MHSPQRRPVRTLFVSDIHMGMRGAQVEALLAFLDTLEPQTIYLVGDIVDGWRLKKSWHWPPACNRLVQVLLDRMRRGTRIVYITGNHDGFLRDFDVLRFGGLEVVEEVEHRTVDGKRYLVIHGDQFDLVVRHARWFSGLSDVFYNLALRLALALNGFRRRMGYAHWSLSGWARDNVAKAAALVARFEMALSREARSRGLDGVICGHIHCAADHRQLGVHYLNCGDWVEHCTAVVEHPCGRLEQLVWQAAGNDISLDPSPRSVSDAPVADRH